MSIFFRRVEQMPSTLLASLIGMWKQQDWSSMLVLFLLSGCNACMLEYQYW